MSDFWRDVRFGIRMALGAQKGDVRGLVVSQGLCFSVLGVVLDLASSFVLTRYLSSLVFEVGVTDPTTYLSSTLLLLLVAAIAGFAPARRATRVEPIAALRYE
jgi:ABC-type antimicrobial peptide transport system permease subunit